MTRNLLQMYSSNAQHFLLNFMKSLILIMLFGMYGWSSPQGALAEEPWVLSNDQRRAFLHYYSPIILKRADEDKGEGKHIGHDWITNFDYDRDGKFSNNRKNWKREKFKFINKTAYQDWQIRPTLYTAAIEFMNDGQKSLILLYHVYHAMQGCILPSCKFEDIHDWERIELRLDGIHPNGPQSRRNHSISCADCT